MRDLFLGFLLFSVLFFYKGDGSMCSDEAGEENSPSFFSPVAVA